MSTTAVTPTETKGVRPFSWRDKIGYMFGDWGNDFTFILQSTFFMIFYTNVMGISAAQEDQPPRTPAPRMRATRSSSQAPTLRRASGVSGYRQRRWMPEVSVTNHSITPSVRMPALM